MSPAEKLFIWDAEGPLPFRVGITLLWRSYGDSASPDALSILKLVEEQSDSFKDRYLSWIYDLGEQRFKNRRVIDLLAFRPGFSYWWMTSFSEKYNSGNSSRITDSIRLMAFENWMRGRTVSRVVLVSSNALLSECLRSWCINSEIEFEWRRIKAKKKPRSILKRLYHVLPNSMQALIWLLHYLIDRWPLKGRGLREWKSTKGDLCCFSYLFNLVPEALKEGRYDSRYWASLPDELHDDGYHINWLHLYEKDELVPTARDAAAVIEQFNRSACGSQTHVTLDTFLSVQVVFRVLRDWFRLLIAARELRKMHCSPKGLDIDIWPLFAGEWQCLLNGNKVVSNLLVYNLFESAMKILPQQRLGVFLQENQSWEFGLVHAWKVAAHRRLIGAPHSTVRYWDLRYFFDPRSYCRNGVNELPLPDQVALNGNAALEAYRKGMYPEKNLVEVEALRYLYLQEDRKEKSCTLSSDVGILHVLVLGDYLADNTKLQMQMLEQTLPFLSTTLDITVKPHPNCPIDPADYPLLKLTMTMDPLWKLLSGCDVACTSATTSAAVDAYCCNVPVVSVLNPQSLNLSPLRDREGVFFASNARELAGMLVSASSSSISADGNRLFFTLNSGLSRWRKLLHGDIK